MTRTCRDLELSIGRPSTSLASSDRLMLEQHLVECADCRRAHALARSITELVAISPIELRGAARERAITAALSQQGGRKLDDQPAARGRWLALGMAAAALLTLGLRLTWPEAATPALAVHMPSSEARPTPPMIANPEPSAAPVTELDADGWIEATVAQQRTYGHAHVLIAAGTRLRFDGDKRTLELASGRVDVDVESQPGETFVVSTHSFRVQVLGTQFAVTPDRVEVTRGHVQVFDPTGKPLVRDLRAGKTFEAHASSAAREAVPAGPSRGLKVSPGALLEQARAALARGDVATTRALVRRATQHSRARSELAEAGTLNAECALSERRPVQAARAYLAVADRYRDLVAGENALFAAAQLGAREGDARAAELLQLYLARYPQGRFADEARARQRKLEH